MEKATLLEQLTAEWQPSGATAVCLVEDMAAAREQLQQIRASRATDPLDPKLLRLKEAALRAFHRGLAALLKLRKAESRDAKTPVVTASEAKPAAEPAPAVSPQPARTFVPPPPPVMPPHLQRQFDGHKRRDPLFSPVFDRSQMSKELRKWFDQHPSAA